jgi:ATP phosphoribosyltransferase
MTMTNPRTQKGGHGPLILALPSKGRIRDEALAIIAKAGLTVTETGNARSYRAGIAELPDADVAYLSSSEIAREIGAGTVHLGITGLDLLHEAVPAWETRVEVLRPLGFGKADVVIAVPQSWLDVTGVADLESVALAFRRAHGRRPRVATKFVNITRRFLAAHGVTSYLIVESLGATEGAPAAGAAEIIVDITETGATIRDNHLKILTGDVILRSEAVLARSRTAHWSKPATAAFEELRRLMERAG